MCNWTEAQSERSQPRKVERTPAQQHMDKIYAKRGDPDPDMPDKIKEQKRISELEFDD